MSIGQAVHWDVRQSVRWVWLKYSSLKRFNWFIADRRLLQAFSPQLSGNPAIQLNSFPLSFAPNSFSLPHFTSLENWARHLCKLVALTVVVLFCSQKAESLMSPLCQIQVPHLIETLRRLAGGENSASKEETELWRHIRAPRVARTWAKPNNELCW